MHLSSLGDAANNCWKTIPDHFPFAELDAHVIMPNHMHGIIIINKSLPVETQDFASNTKHQQTQSPASDTQREQTQNLASLPLQQQDQQENRFGPQSKNLASIIRGYKIGVTKYARQNNLDFAWQPRFHDHVIRNEKTHLKIQNYILTNPERWSEDVFYNK